MIKKNLNKLLFLSLVILMGFSSFIVNAEETVVITEEIIVSPTTLAVCDFNGDGDRNLSDIGIFAGCADTFDVNDDGIHDLSDVGEYAENNQDNDWCNTNFVCAPEADTIDEAEIVIEEVVLAPATLPVCDLNNDEVRNLSDVGIFAGCADTFDVNGDGIHNLSDAALYAENRLDNDWCNTNFVCEATPKIVNKTSSVDSVVTSTPSTILAVCDHNGDKIRNLIDVAMFAEIADTFDVSGDGIHDLNDVSLYATYNQDDIWCTKYFGLEDTPEDTTIVSNTNGSGRGGSVTTTVSNIEAASTCETTTITWDTSRDSLTWMYYSDQSTDYSVEEKNIEYNREHSVVLEGLEYGTTYYYRIATKDTSGVESNKSEVSFTTLSAEQCGEVLGEKIEADLELKPQVLGVKETNVCTYMTPDEDVLGQTEWADGTLVRGCGPEIYRIENRQKRHIQSLEELFNYIGQRIYNVTNNILDLF